MQLAHYLSDNEEMSMSKAMKLAHMNCSLLHYLGKGVVIFSYRKADGSLRRAKGTLFGDACDEFARALADFQERHPDGTGKTTRVNSNTEGIYFYWDIEKQGFRTFKAKDLLSIEDVIIKLNKRI